MTDDWTIEALREHINQRLDSIQLHVEQRFRDRDEAIRIAVKELERRLDVLNHAHEASVAERAAFYTKDQHDVFALSIDERFRERISIVDKRFDAITERINGMEKPNWQLYITIGGLICSLIYGMWFVAVRPIETELTELRQSMTTREASMQESLVTMQTELRKHVETKSK